VREAPQATSPSTTRSQMLPLVGLPLRRSPALWPLPPQTRAHEARYWMEGTRLVSAPTSVMMAAVRSPR
jgi:hypothetical protein